MATQRWQEEGCSISFRSCQLSSLSVLPNALRQAGEAGTAVDPTDVAHLDLAENEVERVEELHVFTKLLSVDVSHNNVDVLSRLPPSLLHLNAAYNRLESMDGVQGLSRLVELNLSYNLLTTLQPVEHLTQLQVLLAGGNRISSLIGLTALSSLELLDMRYNYVEKTSEVCANAPADRGSSCWMYSLSGAQGARV